MKLLNRKRFIWFAVPFIFIIGSLLHFAYDFFPNVFISLIAPINESIWEHTKLAFYPTLLWYWLYPIFTSNSDKLSKKQWLLSCVVSVFTGILVIPLLFYFYTGAFGVEFLWVDILIYFLSVLSGQLVAMHFYKYSKGLKIGWSIAILLIIFAIYVIFTFYPPQLPLFTDFSK